MNKLFIIILLLSNMIIAISTYLIILGASKCKSIEEQKREDEEQIEYLKKYNKKGDRT